MHKSEWSVISERMRAYLLRARLLGFLQKMPGARLFQLRAYLSHESMYVRGGGGTICLVIWF